MIKEKPIIVVSCILIALFGCTQNPGSSDRQPSGQKQGPSSAQPSEPQSSDQTSKENSQVETKPDETEATISGRSYFETEVLAAFNLCERCHAPENVPVERDRGPLTIFSYDAMRQMLDENLLLPMIRGDLAARPHPINDPCLNGLNSSPCKQIAAWWDLEFADIPEKLAERPIGEIGAITSIERYGLIRGWAINPTAQNQMAQVTISLIRSNGERFSTTVDANLEAFDNDTPGPHAFSLQAPPAWLDGERHQIEASVTAIAEDLSVETNAEGFVGLPKPAAGSAQRTYFQDNLQNIILTNCGCHGNSFTYDYLWDRLLNPFPIDGGSASNNLLRSKAAGNSHAGGNLCANSNVCGLIEAWWTEEFGP